MNPVLALTDPRLRFFLSKLFVTEDVALNANYSKISLPKGPENFLSNSLRDFPMILPYLPLVIIFNN